MSDNLFNPRLDAIQFINESSTANTLTGRLTVGHNRARYDLTSYELHWGTAQQKRIGNKSLIVEYGLENKGWEGAPYYVFSKPLVVDFSETGIPEDASHLLVFVRDTDNTEYLYASRALVNPEHLLPASATRLERRLAATAGRLSQLPVQIDSLWDPNRCPPQFLPWLAWANSVDIWYDNKEDVADESRRRRELIRKNAFVHQHKGTRAAIQEALDAFANITITVSEWWQQSPRGVPHTFSLDLLLNGNISGVANAQLNQELRQAIDAIKPVRSHYTFTISTVQEAPLRVAAASEVISYKRFNMAAVI